MFLSMWILADWLKEYDPVTVIIEGKQNIDSVRLFSNYSEIDNHHVYIGFMSDFFETASENCIILMHRNDILQIANADYVEIVNKVIEGFEYYEKWNSQLMLASCSETPEYNIVNLCKDVIGPVQIIDLKMNLVTFTRGYRVGEVNPIWDTYIQNGSFTLRTIKSMHDDGFIENYQQVNDMKEFYSPAVSPYSYGLIDSICGRNGELLGQIIYAYTHPVTNADKDIIQIVKGALQSVRYTNLGEYGNDISASILIEGIRKENISEENVRKLQIIQGWKNEEQFIICAIDHVERTRYRDTIIDQLKNRLYAAIVFEVDECIVFYIKRDERIADMLNRMERVAEELNCVIGKSYAFKDITQISLYFQQAKDSIQYNKGQGKGVADFSACALEVLLHAQDNRYRQCCVHPIIPALKAYDAKHHTELLNTLKIYLKYNCSYLETSKAMFVHRNTVLARIQKIEEVFEINLNDADMREYIRVSALL